MLLHAGANPIYDHRTAEDAPTDVSHQEDLCWAIEPHHDLGVLHTSINGEFNQYIIWRYVAIWQKLSDFVD